jgi:uncharacterized membrane protein
MKIKLAQELSDKDVSGRDTSNKNAAQKDLPHNTAIKREQGEATWENPLLAPGALAKFNADSSPAEFKISANKSITDLGVKKILAGLVVLSSLVAAFSFAQGNVLAPLFTLIDLSVVCLAMFAVASANTANDVVRLDTAANQLIVRSNRHNYSVESVFNLGWVSMQIEGVGAASHIFLGASGKRVEIGSFLNTEQRASLKTQLNAFLELAKTRAFN